MTTVLEQLSSDGLDFVEIDPGNFYMGCIADDPHAKSNETPHMVKLTKKIYMLKTPVTVGQYARYVQEKQVDTSYLIEKWDGEDWVIGPYFNEINTDADYPVVGVSFHDAQSFIEWMQQKYQLHFRLPTEAEFEFCARGRCSCRGECKNAKLAKERHLDRREEELPRKKSFSTKEMIENDYGLLGMHCSVWQWCSDWYFFYSDEVVNPTGPAAQPDYAPWKGERWKPGKVIRGGSFSYPFYHSRCSDRHYSLTTDRNYNVGFRIVFDCEVTL